MRRMLGLGWKYRWGCIRLLVLQALLLCTALSCLGLTGFGIDLIRHFVDPKAGVPDRLAFGFPPGYWSPMGQVAAIAGLILALELTRGVLNYTYALSAGYLIHMQIVVDLRAQVYDKLQRLSFNFFDANATGSIINRVTSDVQSVRAFVDGVLIQLVILTLSLIGFMSY